LSDPPIEYVRFPHDGKEVRAYLALPKGVPRPGLATEEYPFTRNCERSPGGCICSLSSGIDKDRPDYTVYTGEWEVRRIYQTRG
jgi:hypothetical protein